MSIRFVPLPTEMVSALRARQPDAYGLRPEPGGASTGGGTPCRHCLRQVPEGAPYLIAAASPFTGLNPYTETGPISLCADECARGGPDFPTAILCAPHYIVRGYSARERIVYGSGAVVPAEAIETRCTELFASPEIAFIHIRSASNNCFLCRVERA